MGIIVSEIPVVHLRVVPSEVDRIGLVQPIAPIRRNDLGTGGHTIRDDLIGHVASVSGAIGAKGGRRRRSTSHHLALIRTSRSVNTSQTAGPRNQIHYVAFIYPNLETNILDGDRR